MGFQQFIDALQSIVTYLQSIESLGFLNQELPLVNRSVSDLLELADSFAQKVETFQNNPGQALQAVEELIEDAFVPEPDGAPQTDDPAIELSLDGRAVRIDLTFSSNITRNLPFNLDLADLGLADLSNFLSVGASGEIEALLTLLQNARVVADSRRTTETLAVMCNHLVKTSTLLQSIVLSIQEGLQEKIEEPVKH